MPFLWPLDQGRVLTPVPLLPISDFAYSVDGLLALLVTPRTWQILLVELETVLPLLMAAVLLRRHRERAPTDDRLARAVLALSLLLAVGAKLRAGPMVRTPALASARGSGALDPLRLIWIAELGTAVLFALRALRAVLPSRSCADGPRLASRVASIDALVVIGGVPSKQAALAVSLLGALPCRTS